MPRRKKNEDEPTKSVSEDFEAKAAELPFDPWTADEEDENQRRRDPLRQPGRTDEG